jgi:serine/threonine-protein kinase
VNAPTAISITWLAPQFPDISGLAPLAGGGQKLVFSALHATDGEVVLKILRPPVDIEGLRREILAVRKVASPRVPNILDQGTLTTPLGDCFWLRETRVKGQTVRQMLGGAPLAPSAVIGMGLQTLEALVAAEAAQIVHRDVKPENIMQSSTGEFFLLDFGIARHLQLTSNTPTANHFGKFTVGYAPPEQFRNIKHEIDARSDLFATGVTMYECATGLNPFRRGAANDLDVLRRVETQPLPPLVLPIRAASQMTDLVSAMTQRRRDHRPATARAAYDWLREISERQEP